MEIVPEGGVGSPLFRRIWLFNFAPLLEVGESSLVALWPEVPRALWRYVSARLLFSRLLLKDRGLWESPFFDFGPLYRRFVLLPADVRRRFLRFVGAVVWAPVLRSRLLMRRYREALVRDYGEELLRFLLDRACFFLPPQSSLCGQGGSPPPLEEAGLGVVALALEGEAPEYRERVALSVWPASLRPGQGAVEEARRLMERVLKLEVGERWLLS